MMVDHARRELLLRLGEAPDTLSELWRTLESGDYSRRPEIALRRGERSTGAGKTFFPGIPEIGREKNRYHDAAGATGTIQWSIAAARYIDDVLLPSRPHR